MQLRMLRLVSRPLMVMLCIWDPDLHTLLPHQSVLLLVSWSLLLKLCLRYHRLRVLLSGDSLRRRCMICDSLRRRNMICDSLRRRYMSFDSLRRRCMSFVSRRRRSVIVGSLRRPLSSRRYR